MSENKDLGGGPPPEEKTVPALPASRDPGDAAVYNPPDVAPKPGEESTSDENVARARRRRDVVPPEVRARALDITLRHLSSMARSPFRKVLAELIEAKPTPEAVRRFADKYPDRWAQAVSMMAGLSGFDRGVVEVNVFNIKGLHDSELMARLEQVRAEIRAIARRPTGDVQDAVIVGEKPGG